MSKPPEPHTYRCVLCGELDGGYGNNPAPVYPSEDGRCCGDCNAMYVIPARLEQMFKRDKEEQ